MRTLRKIAVPFLYANGTFERNCIVTIARINEKIINIATDVAEFDAVASLEYHAGIACPPWKGWDGTMTAARREKLLADYRARWGDDLKTVLRAATGEGTRTGEKGLLLVEGADCRTFRLTDRTTLKLLQP